MKLIPLTGKLGAGKYAAVSDEDFEFLSQWKWRQLSHKCEYAVRMSSSSCGVPKRHILMHREVAIRAGLDCSHQIDHKYRDTLDNCRHSIRSATPSQNQRNRTSKRGTVCGMKGVYFEPERIKYVSRIVIDGKCKHLGRYDNAEEAKASYDVAARMHYGEFARFE